jgi:hypothetical protein
MADEKTARIAVDDLTEAVTRGVLRAAQSELDLRGILGGERSITVRPNITMGGELMLAALGAVELQAEAGG